MEERNHCWLKAINNRSRGKRNTLLYHFYFGCFLSKSWLSRLHWNQMTEWPPPPAESTTTGLHRLCVWHPKHTKQSFGCKTPAVAPKMKRNRQLKWSTNRTKSEWLYFQLHSLSCLLRRQSCTDPDVARRTQVTCNLCMMTVSRQVPARLTETSLAREMTTSRKAESSRTEDRGN